MGIISMCDGVVSQRLELSVWNVLMHNNYGKLEAIAEGIEIQMSLL